MRAPRAIGSAALGVAAACVALAVHAQSPVADADAAHVSLTWRAPAGCPDEASVGADVARLLAGSQAPVSARADVERVGASWRVVVTMNGGVRRLEAGSCRAIAEATALIVAMAVDPARVAANRASQGVADAGTTPAEVADASFVAASNALDAGTAVVPIADAPPIDAFAPPLVPIAVPVAAPPPAPVADAAAPADAAAEPPAPPPPPSRLLPDTLPATTFALSAAGTLDVGTLPAPGVGPSIAFAWTPAPFRLELSGTYLFPEATSPVPITSVVPVASAVAQLTLLAATARGCLFARPARFELGGCLEAEVASLHGKGLVANPSSGSSAWVAPGAGLFGAWRFARSWAFLARADALIPTIRPDFKVDGTTVYRPSFLAGRLSLGVELRF